MEAIQRLTPDIEEATFGYVEGDAKQIKTVGDAIVQKLLDNNLANLQVCDIDEVGVSNSNRDGVGVDIVDVHELIPKKLKSGWSLFEIAAARCFEMPPGEAGRFETMFNERIVNQSGGFLAPLTKPIRFLTVSSSTPSRDAAP